MAASSCSEVQSGAAAIAEPVAGLTTSKVAAVGAASPPIVIVSSVTPPVSPRGPVPCSPAVPERQIDLLDGAFYVSDPYPTYAWMRDQAPLYWDATNELWGVSRYDDVVEVETRKEVFTSADRTKGGYRPNLPADPALIGLDDPEHHRRRNLVARRFTPRAIGAWEDHVRAVVTELLDAKGRCPADDLMSVWATAELDGPLPLEAIIADSLLVLDGGA